ncbi:MAG: toll/interleukin-1 receptor domain-containing protein [Candidatus Competibacteraceae bacterium]|nr:toll/interleukin-1 receptor domain-containing protein [Candidatus Competibacteraceae bacterium]
MTYDAFLSYARQDRQIAEQIVERLEAIGLTVWLDTELLPGDRFDIQIFRALEESRAIVAVLSPTAIKSRWVTAELEAAIRGGLKAVPLLVSGARPQMLPPALASIQALVLTRQISIGL